MLNPAAPRRVRHGGGASVRGMRFLPRAPRISSSFVVAVLALVVACAGSATAAAMITGKQIKNNTVTHRDVKNGTLRSTDLARSTVASLKGPAGPIGPTGPQGPVGATGPAGPAGLSGWTYHSDGVAVEANQADEVTLYCPEGSQVLNGTAYWGFTGEPATVFILGPTAIRASGRTSIPQNLIATIVCAKAV